MGMIAAFCIKHQSKMGHHKVFYGAYVISILKNLGLFPIYELSDCVGRLVRLTNRSLRGWGFISIH